jgi:hypothetical protein
MTGDININGKKMDVGPTKATAKINSVPTTLGVTAGAYAGSTIIHPSTLMAAGASQISDGKRGSTWVGVEFVDKNGKKWKVTSDAGRAGLNVQAVKAGYGTMKLNPKVPTIVGDRGPEMAFGGMVIPNMAKLPFASPRYDVGQAAKMFEPMSDSRSGGNVINLTQNIYPSEGMNTDAFVRQVVSMTKDAIGQDVKLNAKMKGNPMNVSIKT